MSEDSNKKQAQLYVDASIGNGNNFTCCFRTRNEDRVSESEKKREFFRTSQKEEKNKIKEIPIVNNKEQIEIPITEN